MSKFVAGDIIISPITTPHTIREIKHVYGGDAISKDMITIKFYVFENGEYAQCTEIDRHYMLSLKGRLKKL